MSLLQDEKPDGSGIGEAEETLQPNVERPFPVQRRIILGILCITLLVSLAANGCFLYQHYVVPWELADRLPSRFGKFHLRCKALAVTVVRFLWIEC